MKNRQNETMSPEMIRKIDGVLARVKEPETLRPVADLNLVSRVTYSESARLLRITTDIGTPKSTCMVCGVVTENLRQSIQRQLKEEFEKEFPGLTVEVL